LSAPALVALAQGSTDPRCARTVRAIVRASKALRSGITTECAFLDYNSPSLDAILDRLVARGHAEIVVVPLLSTTTHASTDVRTAVAAQAARHRCDIRAAEPLGTDGALLTVLDLRMREALRARHVRELDGLVLVSAGSSDAAPHAAVVRLAQMWGQRHHLPTSVAFAADSPPSAGEAVREMRRHGRRHVAVASLFIAPDTHVDRISELALEAGAVAVADPLGAHDEISRLVLARYSVSALDLIPV
jgi:sirohydrochlorin ferrochelatase